MPSFVPALADFPFRSIEKLRFRDLDGLGHVNNAVFLTMLETGRLEMLLPDQETPFPEVRLPFDDGCVIVIARLSLDFRAEINYPGQVEIGSKIAAIGRSSLTIEQALFQAGKCVATATTVIVQMNLESRRSQALSEATAARFAALMPVKR